MHTKYRFNRRQLLSLCTLLLLVPALRLLPSATAAAAGRAAWFSAPAALPPLLLYLRFLCRFMELRREGEGLAELTQRSLGGALGKGVLLFFAAWLLLYGGFVLRSGAERYVVTVFPHSSPAVFSVTLGLLALLGALGSLRTLVRAGRMVLPMMLFVLLTVLFFGLLSVDRSNLLPLTVYDAVPTARGVLPVLNILAFGMYGACFLLADAPKEPNAYRQTAAWLVRITLLLTLLSAAVIGSFGAELCARLTQPFFTLVRNLVFFRSLERVEALVVTYWVFPDFLLSAVLLYAAQYCLRLALGMDPADHGQRRWDLRGGRRVIPLCGAVLILLGLLLAPDASSLRFWSERLIPILNLSVAFVLIPGIYIIGKQKKTL